MNVAQAIMNIGSTRSRLEKEGMLKRYAEVTMFKEVLQFIFNPYIRTGIAEAKLAKNVARTTSSDMTWQEAIYYFTQNRTGRDIDCIVALEFIERFPEGSNERDLAKALVTKDLTIGITATTLNKIYGDDFIPMIGIMRGEHYSDFKDKVKGPFIITEKIDGARRLLIKDNGVVTMYSRSGIPDDGLIDIEFEAKYLPDNCVYDGELAAIGQFDNSIQLRQATNSIANSKGKRVGVTFNVFDMIPLHEFQKCVSTHNAQARKTLLAAMFGDESIHHITPNYQKFIDTYKLEFDFKFIRPLPILGVASHEEEIMRITQPIWDRHFEGTMLNTFNGKYEIKAGGKGKSRELLKVKGNEEIVLKVVDVYEGTGEIVGMLGGVIVDYKGFRVRCGSGFNHPQRHNYWQSPERIIGKKVEIEHFGETTNKVNSDLSLNCPIFKRIAGDD